MLDYPGKVASIVFLPGCNFRCRYCHNPEFVLPELIEKIKRTFIPEEIFLNFLEHRKDLLDGVVVTGGEPTLQHDLPAFLQKIKDKGFLVKLDTNGYNPKMLEEVITKGLVDYIAMDVKACIDSYCDVVGKEIDGGKILESIDLIQHCGVPYEFRSTLVKELHSHPVLQDMAKMLGGAHTLYLQTFRPGNTLDTTGEKFHAYTHDEMESIANHIFSPHIDKVIVR